MLQDVLPIEDEDGNVGGLQQQMNDNVPYASQERQELIEVKVKLVVLVLFPQRPIKQIVTQIKVALFL